MLCFALYSATRATTRAYRHLLEPWSLTYPQYLVLFILWNHGSQSVRELGETMELDSGTLSPLIRRLEKSSLVSRQRSEADERVVLVELTEEGAALESELAHIPRAVGEAMGVTDERQASEIIGILRKLGHPASSSYTPDIS